MSVELEVEVAGITFLVEVEPGKPARLAGRPEDCEPAEPREWELAEAWIDPEENIPLKIAGDLAEHYEARIDAKVQEAELE